MGLYFRFSTKTVLAIEGCFSNCCTFLTQIQGLFCFQLQSPSKEVGVHKKVTQTDKGDNLYHMLSCSAIKDWKKKKGGDVPGI